MSQVFMKKQTILLIQSTQSQENGTKRFLEESGYRVLWAGSELSALMTVRRETVDLILLDVALPNIEGLDLCNRFRVRQDTRVIPIILITRRGYVPEPMVGKPYCPDGYLEKPYTESELESQIAKVLHARMAATAQSTKFAPPAKQTTQTLKGLGSKGEPALAREPCPTLITAIQQVPKPEPRHRLPFATAAALQEREPENDREQKPILETVPRPSLKLIPKRGTGPPGKTEPHEKSEQGPEIPQGSSSNSEPAVEPKPDSHASPILSFRGTGDAVVDPATGLFGRPHFEAMFSKEFKRALRFNQQMSCMLINLDGQKMGRRADEALVKAIIGMVQKTIREVDTAAWWSGEAFIVLLPHTTRHDALQAAARILETLANHQFTWPDATNVTISIGVAGLPDENIDSERKLIEVADATCRRAQELMVPPPIDVRSIRR
jgi:diguanylate cyclase (GGDEF)-like protein